MKAAVQRETVTRELTIRVVDGPILDVSQCWQKKVRLIRVERVTITIVNGESLTMTAVGGIVLKSGLASHGQRGAWTWRGDDVIADQDVKTAPLWARTLWEEAVSGVKNYWVLDD